MTDASATPPRLIATDLDGTLLHDDKSVSDRTVAALDAAEKAGVEVFFVTGRPARWMDVVSDHVHGHGLAICANGAAVVDLHNGGRILQVRPLAREAALAVVHALRAAAPGTSFAVERTNGINYEPEYPPFHLDPAAVVAPAEKLLSPEAGTPGEQTPEGTSQDAAAPSGPVAPPVSASSPSALYGAAHAPGTPGPRIPGAASGTPYVAAPGAPCDEQPVLKLLAFHPEMDPDAFLRLARTAAGEHASFTRSSPSALLEISGPGVSKASTLAHACAERGIAPEEVVAFGDMPNDLEMLSWAGTSYAMANAHPDVLAATTHRTHSNNDDGVAAAIERLLAQR